MADLTKEEFVQQLKEISPVSDTAAQAWCQWSSELEKMDCADEILPEWPYKSEAAFRGELIKQFTKLKTRFSEAVVGQVLSLGDLQHCLYSWYISATALKNYGNEVLCLDHTGLYYKTKGC